MAKPRPAGYGQQITYGRRGSYAVSVPRLLPDGRPNPLFRGPGGYGSVPTSGPNRPSWATSTTPTSAVTYNPAALANSQRATQTAARTNAANAPRPALNPLPLDAQFTGDVDSLMRRAGAERSRIAQDRTALYSSYGYTPTFDPSGNLTALAEDPTNPFSRAAVLRDQFRRSRTDTTNSGSMYAGSAVKRQGMVNDAENQASYGLRQDFLGRARGLNYQESQIGLDAGDRYRAALGNVIARHTGDPTPAPVQKATAQAPHVNTTAGSRNYGRRYSIVTVAGRRYHQYRDPSTGKLYRVPA